MAWLGRHRTLMKHFCTVCHSLCSRVLPKTCSCEGLAANKTLQTILLRGGARSKSCRERCDADVHHLSCVLVTRLFGASSCTLYYSEPIRQLLMAQ